jgi:hypothetical protein
MTDSSISDQLRYPVVGHVHKKNRTLLSRRIVGGQNLGPELLPNRTLLLRGWQIQWAADTRWPGTSASGRTISGGTGARR